MAFQKCNICDGLLGTYPTYYGKAMRRYQRPAVTFLRECMESRPKWWNEAFARYDQKKLHAWAAEQQRKALDITPRLEAPEPNYVADRLLWGELYKPKIMNSNLTRVGLIS